jgi:leader peptidase (prepilin peptidase) / N-methyltransferase
MGAFGLSAIVTVLGAGAGLIASQRARHWAVGRDVPDAVIRLPPPVVALLCAGAWAGIVWRWGADLDVIPLLALGWMLVAATDIDLRAHVIPDRLTLRAPPVLTAMLVGLALVRGTAAGLVAAGVTALVLPGVLLVTSLAFHRLRGQVGIGLGDIKFTISLGLILGWLGPPFLLLAVLGMFSSAAVVVAGLLLAGRVDLSSRVPFGPHLAVGTAVALIGGAPAATWVTALLGR